MDWFNVLKNRRNTFRRKGRKTKVRSEPKKEITLSPEQQLYGINFLLDRNWEELQKVKDAIDAGHDVDNLPKRIRKSNSYWYNFVDGNGLHLSRDIVGDEMANYSQRQKNQQLRTEASRLMSEAVKKLDGIHIYSQKEDVDKAFDISFNQSKAFLCSFCILSQIQITMPASFPLL